MLLKHLLKFLSLLLFLTVVAPAYAERHPSPLYYPYQDNQIDYRYINSDNYDAAKFDISGSNQLGNSNFSYQLSNLTSITNSDSSLTSVGVGYSHTVGNHWFGASIASSSNQPFTLLNLIDFEGFYAYKLIETKKPETTFDDGSSRTGYHRLYLGIFYSTYSPFGEKFPLPMIRYEYNDPRVTFIAGYPLNYLKLKFSRYQGIEINYQPVLDLTIGYLLTPNDSNTFAFEFQIEHERYLLTNIVNDLYFSRSKYYSELYWVRLKYSVSIKNFIQVSPYFQLLLSGKHYVGKTFYDTDGNTSYTGFGYSFGTTITVMF